MTAFNIGKHRIGEGRCFIVAEVAQAHDGSLGQAHAYIDAVAQAGADAVKFQCHIAEAESTPDEPWRVEPKWPQDESRFAYWKRMEFTPDQWWSLKEHANARGLEFLCSPFSVEAVKLLDPLVPAWKVASGEFNNARLLDAMLGTKKPLIISTGMSTEDEVGELAWWLIKHTEARFVIMDCTSMYPCPPEKIGLDLMNEMHGLSDHSGTIWPSIAAVTLGASIVEVHVCFSKAEFGFDVESSVTIEELAQLVEGARFIEKAKQPVDKDALAKELEPMRALFMGKHERRAEIKDGDIVTVAGTPGEHVVRRVPAAEIVAAEIAAPWEQFHGKLPTTPGWK